MKRRALIITVMVVAASWTADLMARKGPECVKDGHKYGVVEGNFREEWFSYQERGTSYLEGGCYEAALADLERAIELRSAQDRAADVPGCDQRRARTYGMHFEDWFGHREKGIALYHMGRIDEAIKELELSLQCTESSRAQFYLDKARADRLKSSGADTKNPAVKKVHLLTKEPRTDYVMKSAGPAPGCDRHVAVPYYFTAEHIESMKEGLSRKERKSLDIEPGWGSKVISWNSEDEATGGAVRAGNMYVVIVSEDDHGVQTVEASGVKSPYTFAQKERADLFPVSISEAMKEGEAGAENTMPKELFTIPLEEDEGGVSMSIKLTDLVGRTGTERIAFAIDRRGPQLSIEDVKVLPGGKARIKGVVEESTGFAKFEIGGEKPRNLGAGRFEVTAKMENDRVAFEAVDKAGNETKGVIVLGPKKGALAAPPVRWTRLMERPLELARLGMPDAPDLAFPPPRSELEPWRRSPRAPFYYPGQNEPVRVALDIELYWNVLQEELGIEDEPPRVYLKTKPQTVYNNQVYLEGTATGQGAPLKRLLINGRNVLSGPRTNTFFSKLVYLSSGRNVISIKAEDEKGLVTEENLVIRRVVPRVMSVSERLAVSMLPFYQHPGYIDIGEVAFDNLAASLIEQRRFRYVDRSKVEAAIQEMSLSGAGLVDPTTAVRAGKLTASEAIVIGLVKETETSIEVKAQVVDVSSSRIMVTRDAYHEDKSLSNLKFISKGLAVKLQNAFPVVQGTVAQTGRDITIDLGLRNRVVPGMKVVFFRTVEKTGPDGESAGTDTEKIGEGTVKDIASASSKIDLESGEAPSVKDRVITK